MAAFSVLVALVPLGPCTARSLVIARFARVTLVWPWSLWIYALVAGKHAGCVSVLGRFDLLDAASRATKGRCSNRLFVLVVLVALGPCAAWALVLAPFALVTLVPLNALVARGRAICDLS